MSDEYSTPSSNLLLFPYTTTSVFNLTAPVPVPVVVSVGDLLRFLTYEGTLGVFLNRDSQEKINYPRGI